MRLLHYLIGYTVVEIFGASPQWALNRLAENKIAFWDTEQIDPLTVRIKVFRKSEQTVGILAERSMCDVKVIGAFGLFRLVDRALRRPVLLLLMTVSLLSVLILPCFVWFFQVEGNETLPEQLILRELEQADVHAGIFGPKIYPKKVKDHLIGAIPQLEWATVVQNGCRGTVIVRERRQVPSTETKKGFANIVASKSGIITHQSVYAGQAQFKIGDTVSKGDILVSGIVDLERTYLIERANGEIFARTWHKITACIPAEFERKIPADRQKRCVWLNINGKRIKIFGNSGISYAGCDKMINRKLLTLPEGLSLPVSLETETFSFYETEKETLSKAQAKAVLISFCRTLTEERMRSGQVLKENYSIHEKNGAYVLEGTLECHEMIAETVEAKWDNEEFLHD